MTFVRVEATAEANGGDATEQPESNFTLVTGDGTMSGEARNFTILDCEGIAFESLGEFREARTADNSDAGEREPRFFQPFLKVCRSNSVRNKGWIHDGL
jgi:hypothetical protein